MSDLMLQFTYSKRGYFSTAKTTETTFLFLDNLEAVEEYRKADFIKAVKKALKLITNDKLYDTEVILSNSTSWNEKRLFLICQDCRNRENGTYKLYDYTTANTTNINDVSEKIAFKTLETAINEAITAEAERLSA